MSWGWTTASLCISGNVSLNNVIDCDAYPFPVSFFRTVIFGVFEAIVVIDEFLYLSIRPVQELYFAPCRSMASPTIVSSPYIFRIRTMVSTVDMVGTTTMIYKLIVFVPVAEIFEGVVRFASLRVILWAPNLPGLEIVLCGGYHDEASLIMSVIAIVIRFLGDGFFGRFRNLLPFL